MLRSATSRMYSHMTQRSVFQNTSVEDEILPTADKAPAATELMPLRPARRTSAAASTRAASARREVGDGAACRSGGPRWRPPGAHPTRVGQTNPPPRRPRPPAAAQRRSSAPFVPALHGPRWGRGASARPGPLRRRRRRRRWSRRSGGAHTGASPAPPSSTGGASAEETDDLASRAFSSRQGAQLCETLGPWGAKQGLRRRREIGVSQPTPRRPPMASQTLPPEAEAFRKVHPKDFARRFIDAGVRADGRRHGARRPSSLIAGLWAGPDGRSCSVRAGHTMLTQNPRCRHAWKRGRLRSGARRVHHSRLRHQAAGGDP